MVEEVQPLSDTDVVEISLDVPTARALLGSVRGEGDLEASHKETIEWAVELALQPKPESEESDEG